MAIPLILVTDFSADVGDLGGAANALALHRLGHIDLLGIMCGTSKDKAPGAIDALRIYFEVPDGEIAIGTWQGAFFNPGAGGGSTWPNYIYDNYPHDLGLSATVPDSITEMRRLLAARTSADVVIVEIGPANTLKALMDSVADGESPLNGIDLITASVESAYVFGGQYPTSVSSEWNFEQDPVSAAAVCDDWPTPITFIGFGIISTSPAIKDGVNLSSKPPGNLLREGYDDAGYYPGGREAWDEMGLLPAVWRNSAFTVTQGTNVVNTGTGVNTFTNGAGPHYYVNHSLSEAKRVQFQDFINALTMADPTADPVIAAWPATSAWVNIAEIVAGEEIIIEVPPEPLWRIGGYPCPSYIAPSTGNRMLASR